MCKIIYNYVCFLTHYSIRNSTATSVILVIVNMSNLILDEVQCPICIDTLKKPIRMLSCGHNLCQRCLVNLLRRNSQNNCPVCRQNIQLGSRGVESLPRNRVVENMIDSFPTGLTFANPLHQQMQTHISRRRVASSETSSSRRNIQLATLADSYISDHKYEEASDILNILIKQCNGLNKVKPSVKRARCLLEIGEVKQAKNIYVELVPIMDGSGFEHNMRNIFGGCDNDIEKMVKEFNKAKQFDIGIKLTRSLLKIIKCCYDGEVKLLKLRKVGKLIVSTAVQMDGNYKDMSRFRKPAAVASRLAQDLFKLNKNRIKQFKLQARLLEEIIEEMQGIINVDVKIKCLEISWMLKYTEFCSHNVYIFSSHQKSVDIYNRAIFLMRTVLGEEACRYKIFALCHNDLGLALSSLNKHDKAKQVLLEAIRLHDMVFDWTSDSEKESNVTIAINQAIKIDKTFYRRHEQS